MINHIQSFPILKFIIIIIIIIHPIIWNVS